MNIGREDSTEQSLSSSEGRWYESTSFAPPPPFLGIDQGAGRSTTRSESVGVFLELGATYDGRRDVDRVPREARTNRGRSLCLARARGCRKIRTDKAVAHPQPVVALRLAEIRYSLLYVL